MSEYTIKRYEDLDITDNFMFSKVFSNEDVAKDFLQDVLKISIEKISVVSEATTQEDPFHKSVRFDVLAKEIADVEKATAKGTTAEKANAAGKPTPGRYFDIELQMVDTKEIPLRARYYQGMCDLDVLAKGVSYAKLQEQYILFICPNDIFGKGLSIYRFQNREETNSNILLGDLCYKNFYIFGKYNEIQDKPTREYMQYFATQKHESAKMERIHELVEIYRKDPIAKKAYMTLEQELNIRYESGFDKGVEKARAEAAAELAAKDAELMAKNDKLAAKDAELMAKNDKLAAKDAELADKDAENADLRDQIAALTKKLQAKSHS